MAAVGAAAVAGSKHQQLQQLQQQRCRLREVEIH